jgi:hypothetical protein
MVWSMAPPPESVARTRSETAWPLPAWGSVAVYFPPVPGTMSVSSTKAVEEYRPQGAVCFPSPPAVFVRAGEGRALVGVAGSIRFVT